MKNAKDAPRRSGSKTNRKAKSSRRTKPARSTGGLSTKYDEALRLAARLHREQTRKVTGIPYVAHVLSVSALVIEHGGSEEQAIAALLHDVLEDQPDKIDAPTIERRFGAKVARMVLGCTDSVPGQARGALTWRRRKEHYLDKLPGKDPDTLLVSAADKLHNARAILSDLRIVGDRVFERFNARKQGTLWYYRELVEQFRRVERPSAMLERLIDELERTVTEILERAGG